jgi:hypothetical protein
MDGVSTRRISLPETEEIRAKARKSYGANPGRAREYPEAEGQYDLCHQQPGQRPVHGLSGRHEPTAADPFHGAADAHILKISVHSGQLPYTAEDISHKIQSFMRRLQHHPSAVSSFFLHSPFCYLWPQK